MHVKLKPIIAVQAAIACRPNSRYNARLSLFHFTERWMSG